MGDDLKKLSLDIASCNSMVCLVGHHFPTRLWCAWELFTIFAFQRDADAIERVQLISLARVGQKDHAQEALAGMLRFDVRNTLCYSPNDRHKLMSIINAVGATQFNAKIRKMSEKYLARHKKLRLCTFSAHDIVSHSSELPVFVRVEEIELVSFDTGSSEAAEPDEDYAGRNKDDKFASQCRIPL